MSARLFTRTRTFMPRHALGAGIVGLSLGTSMATFRQPRLRLDARETPRPMSSRPPTKERLDPDLLKQVSSGCIAGFISGILISVFSRTLVLLIGLSAVVVQVRHNKIHNKIYHEILTNIVQVASRYGLDLVEQLKLKQRLGNSRILNALEKNPAFNLSFGLFFAMSAFMKF
ncbi:uncharacterized protein F4812DRAFT_457721 [Daldinia caldariorum]|uniref:uncharacterized protein n=1 Tax=Daldinia caldariorum TaxID=326644 RepID=UPI0020078D09|nr:uncharacterized protein F4812DRAFT_457721 [Daldinia caldariorum]KAI1469179.1 hypothetical protein F4812DRAFT_457721 [Daldinia caldariorum]